MEHTTPMTEAHFSTNCSDGLSWSISINSCPKLLESCWL